MRAGARVLFAGEYAGIVGGIERYMMSAAGLLRTHLDCVVDCLASEDAPHGDLFASAFDRLWRTPDAMRDEEPYDWIVVHKTRDFRQIADLRRLGAKIAFFVHDHEYYCPRRAYYLPGVRWNCHRAYSALRCGFCASLGRHPRLGYHFFEHPKLWGAIRETADRFLVISDFMRLLLVKNGLPSEKIGKLIPEIELHSSLSAPPPGVARLVCSGQLIRGKGVDQLLDSLRFVKGDYILDILGSGKDEDMLRSHPAAKNGKVRFHGWTTTPEVFLREASAALLPWRWQEPFGLVGPEAMAYGLPLIGFNTGGVGEYLLDGKTGWLVPEGDLAGFGRAVDELLCAPGLGHERGMAGRALVAQKFSAAAALESWKNGL